MARGLRRRLTSYGDQDFSLFLRKAFIKAMGFSDDALDRPIVGIANTYSDYNPCHGNVPQLIEAAKRGVMLAGGLPMVFPTMSIHESFAVADLDVPAQPDGDGDRGDDPRPADGRGRADRRLRQDAAGADHGRGLAARCRRSSCRPARWRPAATAASGSAPAPTAAGSGAASVPARSTTARSAEINDRLVSSVGTCTVMGTASTMACLAEAMGLTLPMAGSAPATSAERIRLAEATGRRAVALAEAGGPTVADLLTPAAFRNGLAVLQALGGSTNGVVHLAAIAGRLGRRLDLAELDELGRRRAGARRPQAVGHRLHGRVPRRRRRAAPAHRDRRRPRRRGTDGRRHARSARSSPRVPPRYEDRIIRRRDDPVKPVGAIAVLGGNLAPARRRHQALGRLARAAAARGPRRRLRLGRGHGAAARRRGDRRSRPTTSSCCATPGRAARPGMPEAGYIPIPRRLARQGVKDMVRISDARMSGTAFGTVILHVTPEAAAGGPLAIVRTGDRIRLDVPARRLELLVGADELAARLVARDCPAERARRAATHGSSTATCCRPTRASTSTSSGQAAMVENSTAAPLCLPPRPLDAAAARRAAARHLRLPFPRLPRRPAARGGARLHADAWRRSPTGAPSPPPSASRAASSCSRASTAPTTAPCSRLWPRIPTRLRGVVVVPSDTARGRGRPPARARRARRPDQPPEQGRARPRCDSRSRPPRPPVRLAPAAPGRPRADRRGCGARGPARDARRHRPPGADPA